VSRLSDWAALLDYIGRVPGLVIPIAIAVAAPVVGGCMGWWLDRRRNLVRPDAGVPRRGVAAVRAALFALDRPDGVLRVRAGAVAGVDLVAELTIEDERVTDRYRTLLRLDGRRREVRGIDELVRTSRWPGVFTGSAGSLGAAVDDPQFVDVVRRSHPDVTQALRGAVLAAGWTWRGGVDPDPRGLRLPWALLAWTLFIVVTATSVAGAAADVADGGPTVTFGSGQPVSVFLDPADHPVVRATGVQRGPISCAFADGSDAVLVPVRHLDTLTIDGTPWKLLFEVDAPRAADHRMSCQGDGLVFRAGPDWLAGVLDATSKRYALPLAALALAVATSVVIAVARRLGARRRRKV
jgi:hypothetical protein